jgi:hypothetical protein
MDILTDSLVTCPNIDLAHFEDRRDLNLQNELWLAINLPNRAEGIAVETNFSTMLHVIDHAVSFYCG